MCGVTLEKTTDERDIGVTVSQNLKAQQCPKATQTASTVLGQIMRAFHYRDGQVFINLYKQYVRPDLEFSVAAWAPWTQENCEILERVQKRAVKVVSGLKGQSYEERLRELELASLSDRRGEIDMVQTYKLLNESDSEIELRRADTRRATQAAAGRDNLLKERAGHEFRNRFFTVRVIDEWNNLPDSVKEASKAAVFKRQYRRHREGTVALT